MTDLERLRLTDYLQHILDAIDRITGWSAGLSYDDFMADDLKQDGIVRNLEIIGEAASAIRNRFPAFASGDHGLPLRAAADMRNRLIHAYFDVRWPLVWSTVQSDLPAMRAAAVAALGMVSHGNEDATPSP